MAVDLLRGVSAYNNAASIAKMAAANPFSALNTENSESIAVGGGFAGVMRKMLGTGVDTLRKSEKATTAALVNKIPLHEVVESVSEAEITLQTVIAMRDRVIAAYQDVIKMPI